MTMTWLPLVSYANPASKFKRFDVEVPTLMMESTTKNGNLTVMRKRDPGWPMCLACGLMLKAGGTSPEECAAYPDERYVTEKYMNDGSRHEIVRTRDAESDKAADYVPPTRESKCSNALFA